MRYPVDSLADVGIHFRLFHIACHRRHLLKFLTLRGQSKKFEDITLTPRFLLYMSGRISVNTVKDGASEHSQTYAWLVLLHAAAVAEHDLSQLPEDFGTAQAVLDAVGAGAINRSHLPGPALKALREPDTQEIEREIRSLERPDYHLVPLDSPQYPAILRQTGAPPPGLFVRGDPEVLGSCQVAIVGSRKPTMDGRRDARYFAGELARQGITVTSGLARGIDTEAHRGALGQQGRTVAVLGSGLDCIYPGSNAELADRIQRKRRPGVRISPVLAAVAA